jgi:thiamine biosynthesis lipoprotein
MAVAERHFRAMGGEAHAIVVGGPTFLADAVPARVEDLEARWSRFRPNSELSLLNGMPGMPMIVSPETYDLVDKAVYGWRHTRGCFDPTVLEAMEIGGYDRSFELVAASGSAPTQRPSRAPGCSGIVLEPENLAVTLPYGVTLDPGGIGKGLAADIVVRELLASGAEGAMVNLGGDVRAAGHGPGGGGWVVAVENPFQPNEDLSRIELTDGAIATSSRLLRRWSRGDDEYHHLLDPETGLPLGNEIAAVTVVAGEGWWAEIMSKAAFVAGIDHVDGLMVAAAAMVVDGEGNVHTTPGFTEMAA